MQASAGALLLAAAFAAAAQVVESATIPRYDPVSQSTYEGGFNPEEIEYMGAAAFTGVYGAALAIACIVGTIVFLVVRCGCMCCGRGFCVQPLPTSSTGQTIIKVITIVLMVGVIAGAGMSIAGVQQVTEAVTHLLEDTVQEKGIQGLLSYMDELQQVVDDIVAATNTLSDGSAGGGFGGDTTQLINTIDGARDAIESVDNNVNEYSEQYLEQVLFATRTASIVVAVLILLLVLLGAAGVLFSKRALLGCPLCSVPLWLVFAWVLFAVITAVSTLMSDACHDIKGTSEFCAPPADSNCEDYYLGGLLNSALEDLDQERTILEVTRSINEVIQEANQELVSVYQQVCERTADFAGALPGAGVSSPGFCADPEGLGMQVCPPFTSAGDLEETCGTTAATNYVRIQDFPSVLQDLTCAEVSDVAMALSEVVGAMAFPSEDLTSCIQDGRIIGRELYDDLSGKAMAAAQGLETFPTIKALLRLQPLWDIMGNLANEDCPNAETALLSLYVAFCLLGSFLMPQAIMWLVAWQRLPVPGVMPASGDPGYQPWWDKEQTPQETNGMIVASVPTAQPVNPPPV